MTIDHKKSLSIGGTPWLDIQATRGYADGQTFRVIDNDWSSQGLEVAVSRGPGLDSLTKLTVAAVSGTMTWQELRDEGVNSDFFTGIADLSATFTYTDLTVSWTAVQIDLLDDPVTAGDVLEFYYEIKRTDDSGPLFVAGNFYVSERIENA
jgi:hypothetical protein